MENSMNAPSLGEASPDEIVTGFVGQFVWDPAVAELLDFEQLELREDGTYVGRVVATLLNSGVRTFGAHCMLPEEGQWTAYAVGPAVRLRIRPTTGRARVYIVTRDGDRLGLARRGCSTTLVADRAVSSSGICAIVERQAAARAR
jgi:hypothetical protein